VVTGITWFAPPGTVVTPVDQATVDGLLYDVVGDPGVFGPSPMTGTTSGVEVQLVKASG
jgi:hypothetical protein